jgi:phosphopantetheinyl transferase
MADIDDRWYRLDKATGTRVPTDRHGIGQRWVARWRDGERQRKKSFDRKSDAERFLAQVQADLSRGAYVDPKAGKVTVRTYAKGWLAANTSDPLTREGIESR